MERPKWFCIMILRPTASISLAMAPGIIIGRQTWRQEAMLRRSSRIHIKGYGSELWYVTPPLDGQPSKWVFFIGANLFFVSPQKKVEVIFHPTTGFSSPTCGPNNLKGLLNKSFCFQKPSWCITLLVSADFFVEFVVVVGEFEFLKHREWPFKFNSWSLRILPWGFNRHHLDDDLHFWAQESQ